MREARENGERHTAAGAGSSTHVERLDVADEVGQLFDDLRQASCITNVRVPEASRERERKREGGIEEQSTHAGAVSAYFPVDEEAIVGAVEGVVAELMGAEPHELEHAGFVLVMNQRPAQHR